MSTTTTSSTSSSSSEEGRLPLSAEQIATYLKDGILVVDNLLTPQEVHDAQHGLVVSTLQDEYGVNVHDLEGTGYRLMDASSTFGAGTFCTTQVIYVICNEYVFSLMLTRCVHNFYHFTNIHKEVY